jgi:hypothetical protein
MHLLRTKRTGALVAGLAVAGLALAAPSAGAVPTRAEFAAQAESICAATNARYDKVAEKSSRKLLKRLKGLPKKKALAIFIRLTGRSMVLQGRSINDIDRQLAPIPEPAGDEPAIAQWIESRRVDAEVLKQTGKAIKSQKKASPKRFFSLLFQSSSISDRLVATDRIIGAFGLDSCLLAKAEEPTL